MVCLLIFWARIFPSIVLHRAMTSVLFCFLVVIVLLWLLLSFQSAIIPFPSISCPSLFLINKNSDFFYSLGIRLFPRLLRTSKSFFLCSFLSHWVTTIISSYHAGVQNSNVRPIFSRNVVGISASP